jgi:hypothetical protein
MECTSLRDAQQPVNLLYYTKHIGWGQGKAGVKEGLLFIFTGAYGEYRVKFCIIRTKIKNKIEKRVLCCESVL